MKTVNFILGIVGGICLFVILVLWFIGGIIFCDSPQFCDDATISLAWGSMVLGGVALVGQMFLVFKKTRVFRIDALFFIYGLLYLFFQHNL